MEDFKSGEILMLNHLIALGFCSYKSTKIVVDMKLYEQYLTGSELVLKHIANTVSRHETSLSPPVK